MDTNPYKPLLELADIYASHENVTHWRVSFLVRGDGGFFNRLANGGGCTVKTANKVLVWFSDNWPDQELEWPESIRRPFSTKPEAA